MSITMQIIRATEQVTTRWSGGETTEIMIYPPGVNYRDRDFLWRLSTATLEVTPSTFTALPGFQRILCMVDGRITLQHEGHHTVALEKFEQETFQGDWQTTCFGTGRDFNLMMAASCVGELRVLTIDTSAPDECILHADLVDNDQLVRTDTFYSVDGKLRITIGTEVFSLVEGDLLVAQRTGTTGNIQVQLASLLATCHCIHSTVYAAHTQ